VVAVHLCKLLPLFDDSGFTATATSFPESCFEAAAAKEKTRRKVTQLVIPENKKNHLHLVCWKSVMIPESVLKFWYEYLWRICFVWETD